MILEANVECKPSFESIRLLLDKKNKSEQTHETESDDEDDD